MERSGEKGDPAGEEKKEIIKGDHHMNETPSASSNSTKLQPYLSPLAVWALSVGSAIGWGSLVVTSSDYLSKAGPMGSVIGLLIGFSMMLLVSSHYHFLANRYPGAGGLYNYVKCIFGYDFAFLIAWFMFLIYISIFWANATSIPLFARYFLQGVFKRGYLFTVFGYEVYFGEAIITLVVMWLIVHEEQKGDCAQHGGDGPCFYRRDYRVLCRRDGGTRKLRNDHASRVSPGYRHIAAGDPYRFCFPLGLYRI